MGFVPKPGRGTIFIQVELEYSKVTKSQQKAREEFDSRLTLCKKEQTEIKVSSEHMSKFTTGR